MASGKHYVSLNVDTIYGRQNGAPWYDTPFDVGIMRPIDLESIDGMPLGCSSAVTLADEQRIESWDGFVDCCVFAPGNGLLRTTDYSFTGQPRVIHAPPPPTGRSRMILNYLENGDCFTSGDLGLLLDMDGGQLFLFRNGCFVKEIAKGLSGPYVWTVMVHGNGVNRVQGTPLIPAVDVILNTMSM